MEFNDRKTIGRTHFAFRNRIWPLLFAFFILSYLRGFNQSRSLNDYIQQARLSSPLIRGFRSQILSFQLDSLILRASLRTQVNFLSNDMYAPNIAGYGYDPAITNVANLSALVQATHNILPPGYAAAQLRAIGLQSQSLRDTILLSIRDLTRTMTDQYITAYGDLLTMRYSSDLFNLLKGEAEALKKLAESSVIKQTEFLAFDITVQQQELTYLQAQIQYTADYLTLNYLSGIADTAIGQLEEPKLGDSIPHDFYSSVFYQRFVTDSLRIENERRLISYLYRPTIGAFGDAGYNSSLQDMPYKNFGISFGVNIRVPIYDGNQKRYKYRKLNIEEMTRTYNRDFFIKQYKLQIAQLNIQLHSTDLLFEKITRQVDYAKTLINAYGKLLQTGDVKVTDFVTAITNYLNAQNIYRQNLISRLRIMNQINYWNR
ncbi:MAG: TolC family protein [Flavisolibacter sp.]